MCVDSLVVPVSVSEGQILLGLVEGALLERIDALRLGALEAYKVGRDLAGEAAIGDFRLEALAVIESPVARLYVGLRDVVPAAEAEDPGQAAAADEGG
ncbi:unnamed protein product [marine sediment metagenome]|uniref:Uncharacterized protein n=1 Tax=marine sediment metagenome TaxID=412755 RepID=X1RWG3_9ZZZZ